jgi:Fic family protein
MTGARGEALSQPGEFRTVQNHVGGSGTNDPADAKFVPPPPAEMHDALDAFFQYVSEPDKTSPLVKVAWSHYQFETIHPFQDGNGRVGRILIPLLLARTRGLEHPLLYLSPYFQRRRLDYYDHLFTVSAHSDWAGWLQFFLEAVVHQARTAVATSQKLIALGDEWSDRLRMSGATPTAQRLAQLVHQRYVAINARLARGALDQVGLTVRMPTVYAAIQTLEQAGILTEATGRKYRRVWLARELLSLLDPEGAAAVLRR